MIEEHIKILETADKIFLFTSHLTFIFPKSTMETLEKCVKFVQS